MPVTTDPLFDCIVRGGSVLDGTGSKPIDADIGIVDDRITAIGDLSLSTASVSIDARGCRVAPGFIDIHTHSDISATYDPDQGSSIAMGVTTQVVGNCGLAMALALPTDAFDFEKRVLAPHGARIRWSSFAEFLRHVETNGVATNFVPLAGHGTLRKRVMGMVDRAPDGRRRA